jgi:hypothetical protein
MGVVNTTNTFTSTDTITSAKMNNIIDETTFTSDAIQGTTLQVVSPGKLAVNAGGITSNELATNSVTSDKIVDGTIVNADINASAAIAGTKISPNFGTQNITTTGNVSLANAGSCIVQANSDTVSGQLYSSSSNSSVAIGAVSNNPLVIFTNNAERMRITNAGDVGIGTTTPSTKLQVNGTVTATAFAGPLTGNVTGNATSSDYATRAGNGPADGTFYSSHTANTSKIHIGGFGISKGFGIYFQRALNENSTALHFAKENGVTVGSIVLDTANSTNYNTTSDYRLKEDFKSIVNPLDKLCNLNPINFKWVDNDIRIDGFLAHEVKSVICNAVTGEKDEVDGSGNPVYQQIDQSKLIPIMVAAIQELSRKVTELES